jgi:hypothetical protein
MAYCGLGGCRCHRWHHLLCSETGQDWQSLTRWHLSRAWAGVALWVTVCKSKERPWERLPRLWEGPGKEWGPSMVLRPLGILLRS